MIERTVYIACDGREFYSKSECLNYEDELLLSQGILEQIHFFKGEFNLYTPISTYLKGFQFAGGNPICETATSKDHFISLFHVCNIIYVENEDAVKLLKEIIDETDYDSFGIKPGVNVWSDGEWHNINEEIENTAKTLKKLSEINDFFGSLDYFVKVQN